MEIDRHFIKEKFKASIICTPFVPTTQQLVGILTKGLQRPSFESNKQVGHDRYLCTNLRGSVKNLGILLLFLGKMIESDIYL